VLHEQLISIAEASRRFPNHRGVGTIRTTTVWRWISRGVRLSDGTVLKLEAVRVAGRWLTSHEAVTRFVERQNPSLAQVQPEVKAKKSRPSKRAEEAGRRLAALGA
jgi:hypothetical protein